VVVLASHVIFTPYGFWLPNDPRGSWSDFVRSWELRVAGGSATKTDTRRSVAGVAHDRALRLRGEEVIAYPPVVFDGPQALAIAVGFKRMITKSSYVVYACSILPEHVPMVIARHRYRVESVVRLLKAEASSELADQGLHPLANLRLADGSLPSPWARGCWKVFLDTAAEIVRAIRYVDDNPLKEGKPRQRWSFVSPFNPV
jgi:hypothetical protein